MPADVLIPGLVESVGNILAHDIIGYQFDIVRKIRMLDGERPRSTSLVSFCASSESAQSAIKAAAWGFCVFLLITIDPAKARIGAV